MNILLTWMSTYIQMSVHVNVHSLRSNRLFLMVSNRIRYRALSGVGCLMRFGDGRKVSFRVVCVTGLSELETLLFRFPYILTNSASAKKRLGDLERYSSRLLRHSMNLISSNSSLAKAPRFQVNRTHKYFPYLHWATRS